MRSLVSSGFLAPPVIFITSCLLGAVVTLVWRRIGFTIVLGSSACLFVAATPAFSTYLTHQLESEIPDNTEFGDAEAIVVFGADVRAGDGATPDRLGPLSLDRLIFVADAYRRLHLPVAVSGGRIADWHTAVAELMKTALEGYFAVPVAWSEDQSRTTYENALYTARLLRGQHIRTVVVVTQAQDLSRAIWSFERVGLRALPWPVPHRALKLSEVDDFLPSVRALDESFHALHEIIGSLYYRMIY
jgi:uncharacterized SAM-binding protein YcdF (DUF218 family)